MWVAQSNIFMPVFMGVAPKVETANARMSGIVRQAASVGKSPTR
jgi:hypothetical protein